MKKKELKNLAKQVAECEKLLEKASDKEEQLYLENEIMILVSKVSGIEEMSLLDDLIQEFLQKT